MSGSSHLADRRQATPSSSSLRKTPLRKQRSTGPYGNKGSQPCAEFHGNRKKLPSYAADHSCFDPVDILGHKPYKTVKGVNDTYKKRKPLPLPENNRRSGVVGPEPDYSVRGRNLPIIFAKQIRHAWTDTLPNSKEIWIAIETLFLDPNRTLLGAERPNAGCHQTRRWTDAQVKTWTKLANWLGVQFSGNREYAFPKGALGRTAYGFYHHDARKPFPWPGTVHASAHAQGPTFRVPGRKRKRSAEKRIERRFKRLHKVEVSYLDFKDVLCQRRTMSRKQINSAYAKDTLGLSISEYRKQIPTVLSLSIGPAMQISDVVKRALKNLASRVKKFDPGKTWIEKEPVTSTVRFSSPLTWTRYSRLRAMYSADGNIYLNRGAMSGKETALMRFGSKSDERYSKVSAKLDEMQNFIDNASSDEDVYEKYGYTTTLGDWD